MTSEPCLLVRVKERWEEGGFPMREDVHIITALKNVKAEYEKQKARKRLTEDESRTLLFNS